MSFDHDDFAEPSPIRGLPGALPEGETLLWQGSPSWIGLAVRAYHVRLAAAYFVVLFIWEVASGVHDGGAFVPVFLGAASLFIPAFLVIGLILAYAWFTARDTIYTITSRRVAIHFGLIMPRTINLPFASIEGAALKLYRSGSGDIPLVLTTKVRLGYLQLWPNVRPWRLKHAQPMMRSLIDAEDVARTLAGAMQAFRAETAKAEPAARAKKVGTGEAA